ncbi:hypothetical protein HPB52_002869 [Rhipicephalus sanguineus]|uniref:Uncharacterized protein n=1 Tax=Rhipicephalus sanguineus TaxID=34632 RepID=A0A9D4QFR4_RHISA|nr:hypothetical protein HPB52_002869 [Rhipicephalus sanguineus]
MKNNDLNSVYKLTFAARPTLEEMQRYNRERVVAFSAAADERLPLNEMHAPEARPRLAVAAPSCPDAPRAGRDTRRAAARTTGSYQLPAVEDFEDLEDDDEVYAVDTVEYASGGFSVTGSLAEDDDAVDGCLREGLQANLNESLLDAEDPRIVFGEDSQNDVVHVQYADETTQYAQEDVQSAVMVEEDPQYVYVDPLGDADFQTMVEDLPEECRGLLRAAVACWGKAKEVRRESTQVSEENVQQAAENLRLAGEIFRFVGEMFQFAARNLELAAENLQLDDGNLQDAVEDNQDAATDPEGRFRGSVFVVAVARKIPKFARLRMFYVPGADSSDALFDTLEATQKLLRRVVRAGADGSDVS